MGTSTEAVVYKDNRLIEASYRLSVAEQRIVLTCISQVRRDAPVTDEIMYTVSASDLADLTGVDINTAYRDLKEAALRLKRREVRIVQERDQDDRKTKVIITGWVQTIVYLENEGKVALRFSKDMLPYLSELTEKFTRYKLVNVSRMTSSYAIRMYELLIQWQGTGSGQRTVGVEWLRSAFVLEERYTDIRDMKRFVIDTAIEQINNFSDLTVSYEQLKSGRVITAFIFKFKHKPEVQGIRAAPVIVEKIPAKPKLDQQTTKEMLTKALKSKPT